jgi:menaquinone-dependent protoporphyrinogen oxidase
MNNVLVAYGSKHGATAEIAKVIANELRRVGHTVTCGPAEDVADLAPYDAVVLGSAVYMGRWRREARHLLRQMSKQLGERPLWLFSSGPCCQGDPNWSAPPGIEGRARHFGARGHVVFGGRIPLEPSTFVERAMTEKCPPGYRDLRDWDVIRGWAAGIALELQQVSSAGAGVPR